MPNPVDNEALYDSIVLDNKRSPGRVTLSGHDRKHRWDIKEALGHGGGTTTYKGDSVAQFTAEFTLTRDPVQSLDEFADWEKFAAMIRAMLPKSGQPKARSIYHPDLAANDMKSVSQAGISGLTHDGKGGAKVTVSFLEYRPAKKSATIGLPTKPTKADPNADLKHEINDVLLPEAARPI